MYHSTLLEGISQHHARHLAAHQTVLRPAELHSDTHSRWTGAYMRAFKSSIRQEVAKHFAEFFCGSRVQLRTCQSGLQHRSAPTAAAVIRAHSSTERRQPCNIELLAGASWIGTRWSSVSFSQKQNAFWRQRELFPRGTAEEPHAPDAEAEASDSEPEAHDDEATVRRPQQRRRGHAHWCRGISGASSCRCSKHSSHESA